MSRNHKRLSKPIPPGYAIYEATKRIRNGSLNFPDEFHPRFIEELLAICELISAVSGIFSPPQSSDAEAMQQVQQVLGEINAKLDEVNKKLDDVLNSINELPHEIQGIVQGEFLKQEYGMAITAVQNLTTYTQSDAIFTYHLKDVNDMCTLLQTAINEIISQTGGNLAAIAFVTPHIGLWAQSWMALQRKVTDPNQRIYIWQSNFHLTNMKMYNAFFQLVRQKTPLYQAEYNSLLSAMLSFSPNPCSFDQSKEAFSSAGIAYKDKYAVGEVPVNLFVYNPQAPGLQGGVNVLLQSKQFQIPGAPPPPPPALLWYQLEMVIKYPDLCNLTLPVSFYQAAKTQFWLDLVTFNELRNFFAVTKNLDSYETTIDEFSRKPDNWP